MRRRGFQEVALSLTAPGTILQSDSQSASPALTNTKAQAQTSESSQKHNQQQQQQSASSSSTLQHQQQQQQQQQQTQESARNRPLLTKQSAVSKHPLSLSRSSTASTFGDLDTDSADYESTPIEGVLKSGTRPGTRPRTRPSTLVVKSPVKQTLTSFLKRSKSSSGSRVTTTTVQQQTVQAPRKSAAASTMEDVGVVQRVDGWAKGLKKALQHDTEGQYEDAFVDYSRLNRQITREAIYHYEELTCDQKKLLGQVLTCLDQRTHQLKENLKKSTNGQVNKPGFASAAPTSPNLASVTAEATTVRELTHCLDLLTTIKRMGSKTKVPVVLVYRERKHRTHHRHEEKGQSNKVIFAKEKRDFLSLLGLPQSMITERGIDYTIRPNTASVHNRKQDEDNEEPEAEAEAATAINNNMTETHQVGEELEPDEKNGGAAVQTDEEDTDSPKISKKTLQMLFPFKKKGSVSPQPKNNNNSSQNQSEDEEQLADARSTLSCDTCSSDESSESEDESDVSTDMAVPGGTYCHRESTKPPPFRDVGSTYVTLTMEKVGVKNTRHLISPFVRVSVRDPDGRLVASGSTQETAEWEVINKNYLRAPSAVHLQRALEDLPEDMAIFMELRHYRPERAVISTLCYTFLEKKDLSDGEFVCELYGPPTDYTRKNLTSYTEKAFFFHLKVKLQRAVCEVESLASTQSTISS